MPAKVESSLIYSQISKVMQDISAIGKNNKNIQQGYKFRGIDDVYNGLHDILAKHEIFTVPEVISDRTEEKTTKSGATLIYRVMTIRYHFFASDGSNVVATVIGEGMDSGDKASNKAMAVAHKYALTQVFCIPTEESKDPEIDSHEVLPRTHQVPDHHIFTGTTDQKLMVYKIFQKMGITDIDEMKSVTAQLLELKIKLVDLENAIKELLDVNQ